MNKVHLKSLTNKNATISFFYSLRNNEIYKLEFLKGYDT